MLVIIILFLFFVVTAIALRNPLPTQTFTKRTFHYESAFVKFQDNQSSYRWYITCDRRPSDRNRRMGRFVFLAGWPNPLHYLKATSEELFAIDTIEGPYESTFLKGFWGQKPLLIRNAFDPESDDIRKAWPTWDDIVSLSCYTESNHPDDEEWGEVESGYSSRLITHRPGNLNSFQLELGPFDRKYLDKVMKHKHLKWTLLLNDVGQYMPECQYWMDRHFSFVPRWRRDDAQVSIAGSLGGIGPHVDNYDVFLVQTSGLRVWDIQPAKRLSVAEEYNALVPDIPVRILEQREAENISTVRIVLKPGDMLYLPPRVVHCGTAKEDSIDCMTLSVGFRAPSASDLVARVAEYVQESVDEISVKRYTDGKLTESIENGLKNNLVENMPPSISVAVKSCLKELVRAAVDSLLDNDLEWDKLVGKLVTEATRYSDNAVRTFEDNKDEEFLSIWGTNPDEVIARIILGKDRSLLCCEGISYATSSISVNETDRVERLYANGEMWEVWNNPLAARMFQKIERGHTLSSNDVREIMGDRSEDFPDPQAPLLQIIVELIEAGILRPRLNYN